jgi:hypothetical protein
MNGQSLRAKIVDIKQCEARSSKQRFKKGKEEIPKRKAAQKVIVTKNDGHTPEKHNLDV